VLFPKTRSSFLRFPLAYLLTVSRLLFFFFLLFFFLHYPLLLVLPCVFTPLPFILQQKERWKGKSEGMMMTNLKRKRTAKRDE
jgi:hypothetical protein